VIISFYQPQIAIRDTELTMQEGKDLAPRYIQISEAKIETEPNFIKLECE